MKKKILSILLDVVLVAGAICFAYGVWLAWKPLGFMMAGLAVAAGAFFANYSAIRKTGRE